MRPARPDPHDLNRLLILAIAWHRRIGSEFAPLFDAYFCSSQHPRDEEETKMMMGSQPMYRSPKNCREIALVIKTGTKLSDIEKTVIVETLRAQNFNRTHTARTLGIGIRTLQRKLKQYGLTGLGLEGRYDFGGPFGGIEAMASSI